MNRKGKILLVLALVVVVGMAFRVSWNALRDVAKAIGADATAAMLYPFVVDGLMALALVATLVLTGKAKTFALRVLATYALASLVLNYVHGLVPQLHDRAVDWSRLADWGPANWALVLLATSLPVGSIYFGSDLVAKVLHHQPDHDTNQEKTSEVTVNRSTSDLDKSTPQHAPRVFEVTADQSADHAPVLESIEATPAPSVAAVAAIAHRPRRTTGRVPESARSPRPARTPEQLLEEARSATAGWSVEELTAEAIRKAVRTSPAKARVLRETLRAERTTGEGEAA
ncbi:DUF2637 domain-containing protein [Streptomyces sp. RB6PN25]|uniref:DUF2637 domain-containing protein n=1 Tax=Streptomyces humicola TaxID=2953240 RepID=A0ABT1PXR3_9ACTN|nr:DUF2637 domain-containing protein [Streptomyces humicola]MCQ4082473.1 DUF2637 domain-containing protein [Streptomyces humicola]